MRSFFSHSGNIIIVGFISLAIAFLWLVFKANSVDVQYVTTGDYYSRESQMNDHIQAADAAANLGSELSLKHKGNKQYELQIAPRLARSIQSGNIEFYCRSNSSKDKIITFGPTTDGIYPLDTLALDTRLPYTMKLTFVAAGSSYYKAFDLD